ncbi:MAG: MATE family efflux transporter [Clostridia bacterium]|nr:MATE family efflux transporter [Clostridia bacterium]MBQ9795326.1 MATE family efflux transporter [Clostridia bacterium]
MTVTRDKGFYRNFFSLWSVLVLNNVIVLSVNLADNVMLGNYSEAALSGAATCNQLQFVFSQLLVGLGGGAVILGSQYWGQGRTDRVKRVGSWAILCSFAVAAVFFLAAALVPEGLLRLFTDSPEIVEEGVRYLRVIKYSYPVFALTTMLLQILRSVESVKIGFYVSLAALAVNIALNYCLIFGKMGFPVLGAEGAALATLIARVVELLVVVGYLFFFEKRLCFRLRDVWNNDTGLLRGYFRLSLPIMITDGLFGVSTALQTVILGHMTDAAISANSVATTLYQLLKVASVGSAGAAAVIIGKTIGEGREDKTREYAKTMQIIFLFVGLLTGVTLFFLRAPIISLYRITEEAKTLADEFLLVLCVAGMGMAYQMPTNTGIVRGGGDAKYVLRLDLISIWGIVLPLSALAAFVWGLPPVAVIACLNADQVFKCIPAVIKVNRFRWIKKLTEQ